MLRTNLHRLPTCALFTLALLLACGALSTQTFSHILSFQGRLCARDGRPLPDGVYSVQFTVYDEETEGTALWTKTVGVTQAGGVFTTILGLVTPFPGDLFTGSDRWLGINVGDDPEMAERYRLTPSPWSIYSAKSGHAATADTATEATRAAEADNADTLDGMDSTEFADAAHDHDADYVNEGQADSITSAMIVDGEVTTADIADLAVVTAKLADMAMTTEKIADAAITQEKLAEGLSVAHADEADNADTVDGLDASATATPNWLLALDAEGKWPLSTIPSGFVSGLDADLLDGMDSTEFAAADHNHDADYVDVGEADSITSAMIVDGQVTTVDLAELAVSTSKLADSAVTSAKIADAAVTTPKIGDGVITTAKLSPVAVTQDKLAEGLSVEHSEVADDADRLDGVDSTQVWIKGEDLPYVALAPDVPQTGAAADLIGPGTLPTVTLANEGLALAATTTAEEFVWGWIEMNPDPHPAGRIEPIIEYDSQSDRVILFGGSINLVVQNDTWTYDHNTDTWTEMSPHLSPSIRRGPGLAYSTREHRTIMFGGLDNLSYLDDTWTYDSAANTWTELHTQASPPARIPQTMVYDSESDLYVIFGGEPSNHDDTWVLGVYNDAPVAEFDGSVRITGSLVVEGEKNAVVPTESFGERKVYCQESSEVWFEHIGRAELRDGKATVPLDSMFLETVLIDDAHPMHVFITPTSKIDDHYVVQRRDSFTVISDTHKTGTFNYRVVAKRRGYEDAYMEPTGRLLR